MIPERYPMRSALPKDWFAGEDLEVRTARMPHIGSVRAAIVIDEMALAQIGKRALEEAVAQLGKIAAYEHQGEVESAVVTLLADVAWAKPIIEDELRKAARAMVDSLWSDDEKKNLRDWVDLFAEKLK